MESAAGRATATAPRVAAWAGEAFGTLSAVPAVHRVGLAVVEGGGRRLRFTASDRDGTTVSWCDVDAYDDVPLNSAVRSGKPVIGALAELEERFPEFVGRQGGTPTQSLAAVPIVSGGQVLGGYVLYFDSLQRFDRRQHNDLARLGRNLGTGLRRAQQPAQGRPLSPRATSPDHAPGTPTGTTHVAVHDVPADLAAVSDARRFLRRTLTGWAVDSETVDTATLCLSELVTNALIHSHGGCVVHVVLDDSTVRTTVIDSGVSGAAAVGRLEDPLQVHGRGLHLVDALAGGWGYEIRSEGAAVWFTLDVG